MKNFLNGLQKYSLIVIAITLILGSLLLAFPDKMLAYTAFFIGAGFIIGGVLAIINYISENKSKFTLVLGVATIVIGVIICIFYRQIISVILFVLGAFLLVGGIVNLVNSFYIAISRRRSWILTVILSIASIVLGVVSITNPFGTQEAIVQFIGAGLVAFSVLSTIAYIQLKRAFIEADKRITNENAAQSAHEVDFTEVEKE
ncbi:MAG: DUF308 domain-containing protein [Eubacterium sp.]|nr:DUF308 domain-containing protein [Eubacterium sp.]